jgi:hypothetical protein
VLNSHLVGRLNMIDDLYDRNIESEPIGSRCLAASEQKLLASHRGFIWFKL